MATAGSRTFIAAMQVTLDGYTLGSDGNADWVDSWADGLELLPRVDTFVLGAGMFPGYEVFWTAIREAPAAVAEWLGRNPFPREIEYARIAAETPHLVLSTTLRDTTWPTARIVRDLDELRAFKTQPGGPVYVVGGARLVRSLIDEALLDELRLSVHPVAVGAGAPLLSGINRRQDLELIDSERTSTGRVNLTYRVEAPRPDHSSEFNDNVIAEFRANDGQVGGDLADTPIILIHHIGARTRTERVTPLAYSSQADGRLVIAASNGGSPTHPTWFHNLKAHPTIKVELGAETFTALAEEVTGDAHLALWPKLVATSPALREFQAKTARRIPLFTLTRCTS